MRTSTSDLARSADFIISELLSVANPDKAAFLQRFFKTGKGEYAEGDVLLGIIVPLVRDVVKRSPPLPLSEVQHLLDSPYHEVRLAGLLLLQRQFSKAKNEVERKQIFDFYLRNAHRANNWDLVDVTCRGVVGEYLLGQPDRSILYRLAKSHNLWEQRIAVVSTWTFIKHLQFDDTFALVFQLLHHPHDLMHKAMGWMLREVGKKDRDALIDFLDQHAHRLPRTTLRYAIEHFPDEERKAWLARKY